MIFWIRCQTKWALKILVWKCAIKISAPDSIPYLWTNGLRFLIGRAVRIHAVKKKTEKYKLWKPHSQKISLKSLIQNFQDFQYRRSIFERSVSISKRKSRICVRQIKMFVTKMVCIGPRRPLIFHSTSDFWNKLNRKSDFRRKSKGLIRTVLIISIHKNELKVTNSFVSYYGGTIE